MEKILLTRFKHVEDYAKKYYREHLKCLDFSTIIQHLYQQEQLQKLLLFFAVPHKLSL